MKAAEVTAMLTRGKADAEVIVIKNNIQFEVTGFMIDEIKNNIFVLVKEIKK